MKKKITGYASRIKKQPTKVGRKEKKENERKIKRTIRK